MTRLDHRPRTSRYRSARSKRDMSIDESHNAQSLSLIYGEGALAGAAVATAPRDIRAAAPSIVAARRHTPVLSAIKAEGAAATFVPIRVRTAATACRAKVCARGIWVGRDAEKVGKTCPSRGTARTDLAVEVAGMLIARPRDAVAGKVARTKAGLLLLRLCVQNFSEQCKTEKQWSHRCCCC